MCVISIIMQKKAQNGMLGHFLKIKALDKLELQNMKVLIIFLLSLDPWSRHGFISMKYNLCTPFLRTSSKSFSKFLTGAMKSQGDGADAWKNNRSI